MKADLLSGEIFEQAGSGLVEERHEPEHVERGHELEHVERGRELVLADALVRESMLGFEEARCVNGEIFLAYRLVLVEGRYEPEHVEGFEALTIG